MRRRWIAFKGKRILSGPGKKKKPGKRFGRIPITAVAVFGLGGLVALAVGLSLYLGLSSATENTRQLLQEQVDELLDAIEQKLHDRLKPVEEQARWIAEHVDRRALDLHDLAALDAFMFGALAATPQVAGLAVVEPDGRSRRWGREERGVTAEDWSNREGIREWLAAGEREGEMKWREPLWTDTIDSTVLLHDTPLKRDGRFLGMLGQIVPISDLSLELVKLTGGDDLIPFVLYDRDRVLAHPLLIDLSFRSLDGTPLQRLEDLGDAVLETIWSPDEAELYLLSGLTRSEASATRFNDRWYAFLYRHMQRYGPRPWTIGAYLNLDRGDDRVTDRLLLSAATGLAVLCASVLIAAFAGHGVSRPIRAIAATARRVRGGDLSVARLAPSPIRELDEATRSINEMVEGLQERQVMRATLGRYVPEQVAKSLLREGGRLQVEAVDATVLFSDVEGFTTLTERLGPQRIVDLLNAYFSSMVAILERHGGVVTQFQGDAILATFNVPVHDPDHAANALRAALAMQRETRETTFAGHRIRQRIGINTGPVVAGAVGAEGRLSYTVHGDAVNLAARLESLNKEYGTSVIVSESTAALARDFPLEPLGATTVKGQSGSVTLYALRAS